MSSNPWSVDTCSWEKECRLGFGIAAVEQLRGCELNSWGGELKSYRGGELRAVVFVAAAAIHVTNSNRGQGRTVGY